MDGALASSVGIAAVIALRLLAPLAIWKYPLPALVLSVAIDAADHTLLSAFGAGEGEHYQSYDKALDIYLMSLAMLSMLRNWTSRPAIQIGRALFYYRLLGALLFELTGWRPLLLVFPNAFLAYFAFHEIVRAWWSPSQLSGRQYAWAALAILVFYKLPHELWIHVLQLDVTEVIRERILGGRHDVATGEVLAHLLLVVLALAAVGIVAWLVRRWAAPPSHRARFAADPLPTTIDDVHERHHWIASRWRVFDRNLVEKLVLVGFVTVIFAEMLPAVSASPVRVATAVGVVVTVNTFLRIRSARRGRYLPSTVASFALLSGANIALVFLGAHLLRQFRGELSIPDALFLVLLLTLIVTLYDWWRPVYDHRFALAEAPAATDVAASSPPSRPVHQAVQP